MKTTLMKNALACGALAVASAVAAIAAAPTALQAQTGGLNARAVCGNKAFVTSSEDHSLYTIDTQSGAVLGKVAMGKAPINPTFNRDWTKVYVANAEGASLMIVDVGSGQVEKTIGLKYLKPSGLRFLPDGQHLLISFLGETVQSPGHMGILDLRTNMLVREWPIGAQSERFDITPDGKRAYVGNLGAQAMQVVDLEAGQVIATIPIAERVPFNVVITPDGKKAFIGNARGKTVTVVDTASNTVSQVIETGVGPNGLAFSPDYKKIYVSVYGEGKIQAIDVASGTVSDVMPAREKTGHIRITPDGNRAVYVSPYGQTVEIVDLNARKVVHSVPIGHTTTTVAICGNP